jgi:hypothetical protein
LSFFVVDIVVVVGRLCVFWVFDYGLAFTFVLCFFFTFFKGVLHEFAQNEVEGGGADGHCRGFDV